MGKTIVIIAGGYHPFHAGHAALYQSARRAFPDAEVYVAATNDTSTRPFPFPVKEKLAKLAGVEPGHFVQVTSPFQAKEITSQYNPAQDRLIFVRSEKDATKPPQPGGVKKDGSPSYLQSLETANKLEPFAKHAYMAYLPTVEFGPGMTSATEIRAEWPTLDEQGKLDRVMSLYPRTQGNAKLAATVVGLLDAAIGGEQGVAEAFDQPYRSKTEKSESGSFDVLAKLPDGTNLSIMFNHEGNDEWQVEFYRNNSQEVTGKGDAQRIFATVLNAIQKFITKHKPAHLTFAASKETDPTVYYEPGEPQPNPASRAKLYDRLVQRYAKAWGYRAFRADNGRIVMYELSRMSQGQQGVAEGSQPNDIAVYHHTGPNADKKAQAHAMKLGSDYGHFRHDKADKNDNLHIVTQKRYFPDYAKQQGVAEGAPIVVMPRSDRFGTKKPAQPYRNQGDIVPDTKPPSTEKRGVKGRAGQRPMPQHDVDENQGWAATYEETGQMAGTGATGGMTASYQQRENQPVDEDYIEEKWSAKYKSSINCSNPKGFSQRAHCAGRKK